MTTAQDFGKVAVLLGGKAAEREISLISGNAVLAGLRRRGVDAHPVDTADDDALLRLAEGGFARAFVVLHGRGGEDGVIQGALEAIGLPYTGSGVLGSAIGMDKYRAKLVWQGAGLATPPFALLRREDDLKVAAGLGFPLMIKPASEGSSIGIGKADDAVQLKEAWEKAREYDSLVVAERWVRGGEYTAAILRGETLPLIKLETPHAFYDFDAKYHADTTRYLVPCGLAPDKERELQALALAAFDAVGASGWGRVDLMLDEAQRPWLIEVNTVPGMTDHSLVPMAARAHGIDFDELVWRILETSMGR